MTPLNPPSPASFAFTGERFPDVFGRLREMLKQVEAPSGETNEYVTIYTTLVFSPKCGFYKQL